MTPAGHWRRNLAALWFAQVTAIFGFSFAFPFLPVYLRQLGVHDASALAVWSGVASGASGLSLTIMSPIWGAVADRYGRRSMLLRAMVGGGLTVLLMGFARGPLDLVVLRLVQGATSGTVAASTALVASGTPRHRVGWALGILSSAVAVGSALGPLVGGLAATALGVRAIFWGGGVLLIAASLPVFAFVREVPVHRSDEPRQSAVQVLRLAAPGTLAAVGALLVCQTLVQVAYAGFQPLLVLRLLEHVSSGVAAVTGLAFAASGLASAAAAVTYAPIARRTGYRTVGVTAGLALAAAELLSGWSPGVALIVVGAALAGAFYGSLPPAISSMVGLETPAAVQARVFGLLSSATAVGFAVGPLGSGLLAARLGISTAITLCAAAALLQAATVAARVREPAR